MAEERLRRNLDEAFDPGPGFPDQLLVSRTVASIGDVEKRTPRSRPSHRRDRRAWPSMSPALATALILVLLAAAFGAFLALQRVLSPQPAKWGGCGGSFQCATVSVPLDYSHPGSGTIGVAIVRKPATAAAQRIGSLVMDFGGPGGSGIDFLRQSSTYYSNLNRRFDLVAFDQRGSGRSSQLRCLTSSQTDAINQVDTVLDDPQERQVFINANVAIAEACRETNARLLPFVDTVSAARDLDAIRAALGESKVTYMAFGRGTYLAELYAHMFPTHVRGMVLDGVFDPATPLTDLWLARAAGFEANLQAFVASCQGSAGCSLGATSISELQRRVDASPLRVGPRELGRTLAIAGILYGLEPQMWPQLQGALEAAINGDGAGLLALADLESGRRPDGTYAFNGDASTANLCIDRPVPADIAAYDALGAAMSQASPTFGPAFQYVASICASWPVKARGAVGPVDASVSAPVLAVGATHDPWWPYAGAVAVHERFAGSVLLTRSGYGSLSYYNSLCVRLAVDDYLTRGTTPAPNTTCDSDYPA
jgi:pimeloyl-ACP methyl ester carboxylesterase